MAHFALVVNNVVQFVTAVNDAALSVQTDQAGTDFLNACGVMGTTNTWMQCSYNTHGGVHNAGGIPFRLNYPGEGWLWNPTISGFTPPQPYPSWTLVATTGLWTAPQPYPTDGKTYRWSETAWNTTTPQNGWVLA